MEVLQDTYKDTKIGRIPKDWEVVKANELCLKVTDGTHDSPKRVDKGYNLVTSKNLKNGELDFSTCYQISEDDYIDVNKRSFVEQYDVLFGMIGTIGSPVMITQFHVNFAVKNVGIFKSNGDKNLGLWLCHFFNSDIAKNYIERNKNSSTQSFVALGFLRAFPIINPPSEERNKIAAILSTVDEQINTTDKIIEKSKELKKGLMQKLFSEGTGHSKYNSPQGGIFRKILGNIPSDWVIKEISQIAVFTQGVQVNVKLQDTSQTDINIRFIRIVDYTQNTNDVRYVSNTFSKYAVKKDDIVMVRYGTPGIIGRGIEGVIANNMFKIRLDNAIVTNDFFEYFFSQSKIQEYLIMGSGSSTMPALNFSYLKKFQIALPSIQEQHKIVEILSEADAKIEKEQTQKAQLQALKKGLMQQLLTGKKRVKV
jgi:type I restriction enzyme, S subunit